MAVEGDGVGVFHQAGGGADHAGNADADRAGGAELGFEISHQAGDGVDGRLIAGGGGDAVAMQQSVIGREGGDFDFGAAEVYANAEGVIGCLHDPS